MENRVMVAGGKGGCGGRKEVSVAKKSNLRGSRGDENVLYFAASMSISFCDIN